METLLSSGCERMKLLHKIMECGVFFDVRQEMEEAMSADAEVIAHTYRWQIMGVLNPLEVIDS
jgi:hypothetical protein